jgi:DNA-binding transcriptional LysR family regulator
MTPVSCAAIWWRAVDGKTVEFDVEGSVIVINDPDLVISAALEGIGVAYLYEEYVASLIADGRLVSLLDPSTLPITEGYFLFYPSRRQNPAALRALIDFLRSEMRETASGRGTIQKNGAVVFHGNGGNEHRVK